MAQVYSNPKRANDPHALPDVETFYVSPIEARASQLLFDVSGEGDGPELFGWYWQPCFPGCPDGEPNGPFGTEREAIEDAQSGSDDDESDTSR